MRELIAKYPNGIDDFSEINRVPEGNRIPWGGMPVGANGVTVG
jgi:hypothetical protein